MTMLRMIDSLTPPDFAGAKAAAVDVVAGYAWREAGGTPWTRADWEAASGFTGVVPIWVPSQDPDSYTAEAGSELAAQALATILPIPSDAALTVDIEMGMWSANPTGVNDFLQAWVTTVQAVRPAGVYAPYDAFLDWPAVPVLAWIPDWIGGAWPADIDVSWLTLAEVVAWQFSNSVATPYGTVDYSVVDVSGTGRPSPAPPPSPARLIAQGRRQAAQEIVTWISETYGV